MCGIWLWISQKGEFPNPEKGVKGIEARGPEGTRVFDTQTGRFIFSRLAINGLREEGMQPFQKTFNKTYNGREIYTNNTLTWMCNGEIYNAYKLGIEMPSGSDCEVLGELWLQKYKNPVEFARALDGVFAIALYDEKQNKYIIARDPYGVRPLFYATLPSGTVFASERKAIEPYCGAADKIFEFPPGQVWEISVKEGASESIKHPFHTVPWIKIVSTEGWQTRLREGLEAAVKKRVELSERPIAALLSGGLDSSLIAALVQRELKQAGKAALKTFSIGMKGSSDLAYARKVANWIGSDHTEIVTTAEEMFEVIPEVIRDIESYDITTVRASVGNWMIAREIRKRTDCKVVFNGDGSDEIFGGYLYFYRAPSDEAFEEESERLLKEISRYDVLRSDRSISSHGLEARTPFLDKGFVALARSLPTDLRRPSETQPEKWCLRQAFANTGLLPEEVLWRRKEAFSDGVSSAEKSWFQEIQERIDMIEHLPDIKATFYTEPIPKTKEANYYRYIYESMYKHTGDYWPFWMPRWSGETSDPSARTLAIYKN